MFLQFSLCAAVCVGRVVIVEAISVLNGQGVSINSHPVADPNDLRAGARRILAAASRNYPIRIVIGKKCSSKEKIDNTTRKYYGRSAEYLQVIRGERSYDIRHKQDSAHTDSDPALHPAAQKQHRRTSPTSSQRRGKEHQENPIMSARSANLSHYRAQFMLSCWATPPPPPPARASSSARASRGAWAALAGSSRREHYRREAPLLIEGPSGNVGAARVRHDGARPVRRLHVQVALAVGLRDPACGGGEGAAR